MNILKELNNRCLITINLQKYRNNKERRYIINEHYDKHKPTIYKNDSKWI